ncbi:MAG: type II toxin-antitoxin system RelE/ParE family toxin [Acidobacteria bacterium]|nr:type II toxin-antitoxin system RelE/ParE family toxin [Acidobacteriota bacterium]
MARRIRWTLTAANDLEEIAEYISESAPLAARRFVRHLRDSAHSLKALPERGRRVPELQPSDLRELLIGDYRLIYQVEAHAVLILTIAHGARDLEALWRRRLHSGKIP